MECKKPYMIGAMECPCQKCMPCRINKRRLWTHRIVLEMFSHKASSFVTLTYDEKNLPEKGYLAPEHVQKWLKRLRFTLAERSLPNVRYYLVGEYGETTWRPHYHVALFGYAPCLRGRTDHRLKYCCDSCQTLKDTWGLGGVDVGELTLQSAQYIAGYVLKKMTSYKDERLCGRPPEFARMSRKRGLGASAMTNVVSALNSLSTVIVDVPRVLSHGQKKLPLGRYLRRVIREGLGRSPETPSIASYQVGAEMRRLFEEDQALAKKQGKTVGQIIIDRRKQKVLNLESRTKLYSSKKGWL